MPIAMPTASPAAFQSQKASYVALAALCTLTFALFTSIWESDVSGSMAVVGLFAVYMASSELLLVYAVFSPASVIIDIIRLSVRHRAAGGWLIFFVLLEMVSKIAGAVLAWSLYKTTTSGDGGGGAGVYQPVGSSAADPFNAYRPPQAADGAAAVHQPVPSSYQAFPQHENSIGA